MTPLWKTRRLAVVRSGTAMLVLGVRNLLSRCRVVAPGGPVVSLTSYSARIDLVHFAIESIGRGDLLPSRLILWLAEPDRVARPSAELRRLARRGLEILPSDDVLSHKKYFPYVAGQDRHVVPFVTADDDTIYPRDWLATLAAAHEAEPDLVVAHRCKRIATTTTGIAGYADWGRAGRGERSPLVFPTGVGGVLYPAAVADALREAGRGFVVVAPRADDVWLHRVTLRAGTTALSIGRYDDLDFVPVRGGGSVEGLWESNVGGGGNDRQIEATYEPRDVAILLRAARG